MLMDENGIYSNISGAGSPNKIPLIYFKLNGHTDITLSSHVCVIQGMADPITKESQNFSSSEFHNIY